MEKTSPLAALGLNSREIKIYTSLLKGGPTSIRQIAAQTKINRGTTYETLKNLVNLGLVSFHTKGARNKYFAESPEKINGLIIEKQAEIDRLKERAGELIINLKGFGDWQVGGPKVRFYEDDEGIVAILRDVLQTASKLKPKEYRVYSSRQLRQYLYRRFPNFTRQRIKDGIFVKAIAIGTGGDPAELSERKFLEEGAKEFSSSYSLIYGSKVALISVSSDLTPYGVVIEDAGVAAMHRLLFNRLWRTL